METIVILNLKHQKELLESKKKELERSIDDLDLAYPTPVSSTDFKNGPHDSEDEATDLSEMERERAILANQRTLLVQVDQALQRIEKGTYGLCLHCGKPIPPERLLALPWAERDVACEALLERQMS